MFLRYRVRDGYFWKNPSAGFYDGNRFRKHTSPFARNGVSDILGVYRGQFVALEVKRPGVGRLSEKQKFFIDKIKLHEGRAAVVDSVERVKECFLEWFDVSLE